jgi:hypothetical protein
MRPERSAVSTMPAGVDLVEYYYERGFSDGLPLVPPTQEKIDGIVARLGGEPGCVSRRASPRAGAS